MSCVRVLFLSRGNILTKHWFTLKLHLLSIYFILNLKKSIFPLKIMIKEAIIREKNPKQTISG